MFRSVWPCAVAAMAAAASLTPSLLAQCDTWTVHPTPTGTVNGVIAVADPDGPGGPLGQHAVIPEIYNFGSTFGCGIWDGTTLSQFGAAASRMTSAVEYNGQLVVGGNFSGNTLVYSAATWNGSAWTPIGATTGQTTREILCMTVYNGDLIAAGSFDAIDGVPALRIARWDGTQWHALGAGVGGAFGSGDAIYTVAVYNGELYAGGAFTTAGGNPANRVARWDGSQWQPLAGGVSVDAGFFGGIAVTALCVYDNQLFVGGSFLKVDTISTACIGSWNGTAWTAYGTGIDFSLFPPFANVRTMAVIDDTLYVGGIFDNADGTTVNGIVKWDGSTWSLVGAAGIPLPGSLLTGVYGMANYNGNLVASGNYTDSSNQTFPYLATYSPCPVVVPCAADFNGVNGVTVQDIFDFLTAWLAGSASADFNHVNGVTVQDIFDFLTAWLAGC